tara:strand:+ start:3645 stop:5603 length:1959 start_codon:yes stop_codon:yes gene_type:complete
MSNGPLRLLAGAGAGDDPVYVDDVFSTFLYKGNGSTQNIVNGLDLSGEGGMVYLKCRDAAEYGAIYDTARGQSKVIYSALTAAQASNSDLSSFNNNGFSLSYNYGQTNTNDKEYVAWSFRKQEKFFDIVTYTGNGTAGRTVSHNLGSVPGMILIKNVDYASSWAMYHRGTDASTPEGYFLILNNTDVRQIATSAEGGNTWNNTAPTATEFTLGDYVGVNRNGDSFVAYVFGHDESEYGEDSDEAIIKCGRYTGNGTTGKFINLGFEPQFLMIKSLTSSHDWYLADSMRGMANTAVSTAHKYLYAQSAQTEESYEARWRTEPTGFHLTTGATGINGSGNSYMYVAIARSHKPASEFAATDLFVVDESDTTGDPKYRSTFPVDLSFDKWATQGGSDTHVSARLLQGRYVRTNSDAAAANEATYQFDYMNGFHSGSGSTSGAYAWMFRRAKGFMDVVTYVGDGSSSSYAHNLGVTPEFKIIKIRSDTFGGVVGGSALTGGTVDYMLMLNSDAARANTNYWSAVDSATQFSVKASNYISNVSGQTYIAILFATVPGISKVGTYTGTASDLNIDCGFSAGARLVLIKRTDSTGDWYLWDSVRGIVAGNDYYILLNTTDSQNSSYDYIDPLSSGFTVTSSANFDLNTNGGSYLFLAIA